MKRLIILFALCAFCQGQGSPAYYSTGALKVSGAFTVGIGTPPANLCVTEGGGIDPPNYGNVCIDTNTVTIGAIPNVWTNYGADYGFSGAGTITKGTRGMAVARVSDGNIDPNAVGASFCNNYSGGDGDQHWSVDHSMFTVCENAGLSTFIGMLNSSGSTITSVPLIYNGGILFALPSKAVAFDQDTAKLVYIVCAGCTGSGITSNVQAIYSYNLSGCTATSCHPTPTLIYDFGASGNCLAGISQTWNGIFSVSHLIGGSRLFQIQYSTTGGQNTGVIQALYKTGGGGGCRVWNTGGSAISFTGGYTVGAGSVYGAWGTNGQVNMIGSGYTPLTATVSSISCSGSPGNYCTVYTTLYPPVGYGVPITGSGNSNDNATFSVLYNGSAGFTFSTASTIYNCSSNCGTASLTGDLFTIHGIYVSEGNQWIIMSSDNWSGTGGSNSIVAADQPYFWDVGTTNVIVSGGISGHIAGGYANLIHGTNYPQGMFAFLHLYDSPTWSKSTNNNWNLVPTIVNSGSITLDSHCSWANADVNDTYPALCSTSNEIGNQGFVANVENNGCAIPNPLWTSAPNCGTTNPFTGPYVQEILLEPTSGPIGGLSNLQCSASSLYSTQLNGKYYYSCAPSLGTCTSATNCQSFWRVGNSLTSVTGWNFNGQNATLDFSPDGYAYSFTSDWLCTLGTKTHTTISGGNPVGNPPVCGGLNWIKSQTYFAGNIITPLSGNTLNCTFVATPVSGNSGVTGATAQTWENSTTGDNCVTTQITDGGIYWNLINTTGTAKGQQNMRADLFVGLTQ